MTPVIDEILNSFDAGQSALFVTGRSLRDIAVDQDDKVRPLIEILRRVVRRRYGMALITYSMAEGIDWDEPRIDDERDRRTIENVLRSHHLTDIRPDENQNIAIIRAVTSLCRAPADNLRWVGGHPMRFAVLLEFAEHLAPSIMNGTQSDSQVVAIELAHVLAHSLALRASGNLLLLHGRDGLIDELVRAPLREVRLHQPALEEKSEFLEALRTLYPDASFQEGLTPEGVVHASTNTPNRSLEVIVRASHRNGTRITAKQLAAQKQHDVERLSEGTLRAVDLGGVRDIVLAGRNIAKPLSVMRRFAETLAIGDKRMPQNLLLAGPPASGKTVLARIMASEAGAAFYEVASPKSPYVGATERLASLQQRILKDWVPNIAFCDEVIEALPLERTELNTDSGASQAVTAALLSALSDESRRGKSLFVGTTNVPQRLGLAMRSRFVVVPVLQPLKEDLPEILLTVVQRIAPEVQLEAKDSVLREAADIFSGKGANTRHIFSALSHAALLRGGLDADAVLLAACDLMGHTDRVSGDYADLWAVRLCTSKSFLPWADEPRSYPFPEHLQDIVDPTTGDVKLAALDKRIRELEPHANV